MAPSRGKSQASKKTKSSRHHPHPPNPPTTTSSQSQSQPTDCTIPTTLQQRLLTTFESAFATTLQDQDLQSTLQEVKARLFARDFAHAFGQQHYLNAYAARWSPSRALAYLQLFAELVPALFFDDDSMAPISRNGSAADASLIESMTSTSLNENRTVPTLHVTCIGGGAGAELAAFGALQNLLSPTLTAVELHLLDIADWSTPLSQLQSALSQPAKLSPYASTAAKASNIPLIPDSSTLNMSFHRSDILDSGPITVLLGDETIDLAPDTPSHRLNVITILFTLNELYATSIPKTQAMLLRLTKACTPGTVLLVVDSPGSYSTVTLGSTKQSQQSEQAQETEKTKERQYPMHWLLELVLLRPLTTKVGHKNDEKEEQAPWTKIEDHSTLSRWFRFEDAGPSNSSNSGKGVKGSGGLKYALPLEDMRCQVHVYRRNDV